MSEPDLKQMRASIARASRRGHDPAVAEDLRRNYAAAKIEQYVREVVATSPPLTSEQATRLVRLIFQTEP